MTNTSAAGRITPVERTRLESMTAGMDPTAAVAALRAARPQILSHWLVGVQGQPFHLGRPTRAVSDHIPALLDALVDSLATVSSDVQSEIGQRVAQAATQHAQARVAQGLLPGEIVVEFRILREEVQHALAEQAPALPDRDLLGAQMLLGVLLDHAITVAIEFFVAALEQAKDDFVGIAAHDLRNPLTPLKGAAQLLKRQIDSGRAGPESLARHAEVISLSVARMEQLIDNLLDVTRVQTGRLEVRPALMDLSALVTRVVTRQSEEARQRTLLSLPAEPVLGEWEETRIEQVLENLLSNALKYAPDGAIHVRLRHDQDDALLEVQDQGIGLSAEDRAQLFRRFYRSPEVIDRKLEGSGLGLYISRGIVEAHGGSLEAFSAGPGTGATISVRLPLRADWRGE